MSVRKKTPDEIRETVREGYGKIAVGEELQPGSKSAGGCCGPNSSSCSPGTDPAAFAKSIGYTAEEVAALPEGTNMRSEEHTSELQSQFHLVCRLLLEKKKTH